jgi:high-affinity nickel-transport protein
LRLGGIADRFGFEAGFWRGIGGLNENFGTLGCVIVAVFAASWVASMLVYRLRGYDRRAAKPRCAATAPCDRA